MDVQIRETHDRAVLFKVPLSSLGEAEEGDGQASALWDWDHLARETWVDGAQRARLTARGEE